VLRPASAASSVPEGERLVAGSALCHSTGGDAPIPPESVDQASSCLVLPTASGSSQGGSISSWTGAALPTSGRAVLGTCPATACTVPVPAKSRVSEPGVPGPK